MKLTRRKLLLGVVGFLGVLTLPSFIEYFLFYATGQVEQMVVRGDWKLVVLNIGAFLLFLIPLNYRRKADWKSYGVYTAFIVSLFVEMYGVPLTVFLSSSAFSTSATVPVTAVEFSLLGHGLRASYWMVFGFLTTVAGMLLVAVGWATIYRKNELVTSGVYSYSRHPQYLGIMLIAAGWFIGWPTLLTTAMLPILLYTYYRLCLREEKEVMEEVGEQKYREYRRNTPMLC